MLTAGVRYTFGMDSCRPQPWLVEWAAVLVAWG
jgi:hypothetical protein